MLARNGQRAREQGRHPLTYTEVKAVLVQYLNGKGKSESSLWGIGNMQHVIMKYYLGNLFTDPYGGKKKISEEQRMTERVTSDVLKQVKMMTGKQQNTGGTTGVKQKSEGPKLSMDERLAKLCTLFNSPQGCEGGRSCGKDHKCSRFKGSHICYRRHSASKCDNPRVN